MHVYMIIIINNLYYNNLANSYPILKRWILIKCICFLLLKLKLMIAIKNNLIWIKIEIINIKIKEIGNKSILITIWLQRIIKNIFKNVQIVWSKYMIKLIKNMKLRNIKLANSTNKYRNYIMIAISILWNLCNWENRQNHNYQ